MKKYVFLLTMLLVCTYPLFAQEEEAEESKEGWEVGAGLGLDFAQLLQINPRVGAGQNRIGLGGATNVFAKYRKGRLAWDNLASWQFGVQRIGSGQLGRGLSKVPFQKANDELRINSKVGFQTSEDSKLFYAADFSFLSQVTPSYIDTSGRLNGFYLENIEFEEDGRTSTITNNISKFFSPATVTFSIGIDYKPIEELSFYYSPVAYKGIYVMDDAIAELGVHGNEMLDQPDADGRLFSNTFHQLGSLLRTVYTDKYFKEKINFTSSLTLYSNYLKEPQNVDIDWTNELAYEIIDGLQLAILANVFYDHDIKVQITDNDAPGGVNGVGRRVSFTQQLLIKYNVVF